LPPGDENFDAENIKANHPFVKMIEIKLSPGQNRLWAYYCTKKTRTNQQKQG
jgi:hypothetical protein